MAHPNNPSDKRQPKDEIRLAQHSSESVFDWAADRVNDDRKDALRYGLYGVENGKVDRDRLCVFVDDEWHDVTPTALDIIEKLTARPRVWMIGWQLKSERDSAERPDKIIHAMPAAVLACVESHPKKGYRWVG